MSKRKTLWSDKDYNNSITIEYGLPHSGFSFGIRINEGSIVFNLWSIYLTVSVYRWRKKLWDYDFHSLGMRFFDMAIWVDLWSYEIEHSYEKHVSFWDKSKRRFSWHPLNTILGDYKHTETEGEPKQIVVTMPEGQYFGTATPYVQRWKRPRWFFSKVQRGLGLDFPDGIPVPGKGTESYNCGEDAIFGTGFQTDDIDEAAKLMAERVLELRTKYAGRTWEPRLTVEQKLDKEHRIEYANDRSTTSQHAGHLESGHAEVE